MPAPIDLLYRLTDRDKAFPHWGPSNGRLTTFDTAGTVGTTLAEWDAGPRPPDGTILFVTSLIVTATSQTPQSADLINMFIENRITGAIVARILHDNTQTIVAPDSLILQSAFDFALLLDRHYLRVTATFSSPIVVNQVSMDWTGYAMPQGSIGFN